MTAVGNYLDVGYALWAQGGRSGDSHVPACAGRTSRLDGAHQRHDRRRGRSHRRVCGWQSPRSRSWTIRDVDEQNPRSRSHCKHAARQGVLVVAAVGNQATLASSAITRHDRVIAAGCGSCPCQESGSPGARRGRWWRDADPAFARGLAGLNPPRCAGPSSSGSDGTRTRDLRRVPRRRLRASHRVVGPAHVAGKPLLHVHAKVFVGGELRGLRPGEPSALPSTARPTLGSRACRHGWPRCAVVPWRSSTGTDPAAARSREPRRPGRAAARSPHAPQSTGSGPKAAQA